MTMPPSSWKSIAYFVGMKMMNANAPTLTMSDKSFAMSVSWAADMLALTKGRQILRVKVLAAPIDITAAGTRAPMAIAAKEKPTNQSGNILRKSCGTTSWAFDSFSPAARPIRPSRAIKPRTSE